ncbi:hypothetical protein EPO04_02450 [Patescibacteria group bacterium]|nr:MAG: hypothetical protein EPO04_02450 [Patescibacteria group bacterium]
MDEQLISQVEDLGLSNKEARVYVANLMLGPAGVQQIADASGIKRVTTYVILESLVGLGLVSQTSKAKKTLFNAESPENLRRLLDKKEQAIKDQKAQLDELLPQLGSLQSMSKESPSVKFYEGAEGIQTVVRSFIAESKEEGIEQIYGISNLDQLYAMFPEVAESESNPDRVSAGIKSKIIYTSVKGPIMASKDDQKLRQSRYVDPKKYPINGDMAIVGDRVAMVSLVGSQPIGVVIKSEELARSWVTLFELAWEAANNKPTHSK